MSYGKRTLAAIGQRLNTLLGGWPDETLSSRCHRWARDGIRGPSAWANGGGWQPGRKSRYESEREGRRSTARGHGILNRYNGFQTEAGELKRPPGLPS